MKRIAYEMALVMTSAIASWAVGAETGMNGIWPGFRGPCGSAVSPDTNTAVSWNIPGGTGLLWKADLPLPGAGSPIIWGDRVYLSGADTGGHGAVFAYDAKTGKLLWRGDVPLTGEPRIFDEHTTFAAPTPVTDGKRVYAVFATGAIAAFNIDGTPAWKADLGVPDLQYGYASSPVLHNNLLIVQFDQEAEGLAELVAFEAQTGKVAWRSKRSMGGSWCSPIIAETAKGPQLVVVSCGGVAAYEPAAGSVIWTVKRESSDVVCTPVFTKGLVVATLGSSGTLAVRPDGRGDVTATHVAWENGEAGSDVASAVAFGDWVFVPGYALMALNAATGKKEAELELNGTIYASPIVAGGKLYLVDRDGAVTIARADKTLGVLGKPAIGEPVDATPAVANGCIFVRTHKRLICIKSAGGEASGKASPAGPK
jgi:outer membrane protein assembly factor BamB